MKLETPAIELKNISKTFGSIKANRNVNLTVNNGEILSARRKRKRKNNPDEHDIGNLFSGRGSDLH